MHRELIERRERLVDMLDFMLDVLERHHKIKWKKPTRPMARDLLKEIEKFEPLEREKEGIPDG